MFCKKCREKSRHWVSRGSGTKSVLSIRTKPGHWFHSSHPAGVQMKETSLCSSFPAGWRLLSAFQEVVGDEKMSFMFYSNVEPASPHSPHPHCTFLIGPTLKPLYYKRLQKKTNSAKHEWSENTAAIMLNAADLFSPSRERLKMSLTLSSFVSLPNNTVRNETSTPSSKIKHVGSVWQRERATSQHFQLVTCSHHTDWSRERRSA